MKDKPPKMPKHYEQPESLKKAMEKASTERERISAQAMSSALAATNKKPFNKKKLWLMVSPFADSSSILALGAPVRQMTFKYNYKKVYICLQMHTAT